MLEHRLDTPKAAARENGRLKLCRVKLCLRHHVGFGFAFCDPGRTYRRARHQADKNNEYGQLRYSIVHIYLGLHSPTAAEYSILLYSYGTIERISDAIRFISASAAIY